MTQAELDRRKVDPVLDKAIKDLLATKGLPGGPKGHQVVSEHYLHGNQDLSTYQHQPSLKFKVLLNQT